MAQLITSQHLYIYMYVCMYVCVYAFFAQTFRTHPSIRTSRQRSLDIPGAYLPNPRKTNFRGKARTFVHHPFALKTPTPPGGLRTQNVSHCALFSYLINVEKEKENGNDKCYIYMLRNKKENGNQGKEGCENFCLLQGSFGPFGPKVAKRVRK